MIKATPRRLKAPLCFTLLLLITVTQSCKKTDVQKDESAAPVQIEDLRAFISKTTGTPLSGIEYLEGQKAFRFSNDGLISLADAQLRAQSTVGIKQKVYDY